MTRYDDRGWNRCDVCGKFIGFDDLISGAARIEMITPDTDWTYEKFRKLCAKHNDKPVIEATQ